MILKSELRQALLLKRKNISSHRRAEASQSILQKFEDAEKVLSFSSFGSEIDLWTLNRILASRGSLYLPRIEGTILVPYRISDPDRQLVRTDYGIFEPDPNLCSKASISEIHLILVPGLGFEPNGFRLGYGKGHYDRWLKDHPYVPTIGVGFEEQRVDTLPLDPWDIPVKSLCLF